MKSIISLAIILLAINSLKAAPFQHFWYVSYTAATISTPDYHNIAWTIYNISPSSQMTPQAATASTFLMTLINDVATPTVYGAAAVKTGGPATDTKYKNFLVPANGIHPGERPYVIYDIAEGACINGQFKEYKAKIKFFSCAANAETFRQTVATSNHLLHDGTSAAFTNKFAVAGAGSIFASDNDVVSSLTTGVVCPPPIEP